MFFKTRLVAAAASIASLALCASPATAASVLPTVTFDGQTYSSGEGFSLFFNGVTDPNKTVVSNVESKLDLTFTGVDDAGQWNFDFQLLNLSKAPHTNSKVTGFGFNTDPVNPIIKKSSEDSDFFKVSSGSIANSFHVDFCVTGGPNCAGGSNNGPLPGQSFDGSFSMVFGSAQSALTLSNFHTRYQSLARGGSATGVLTSYVSNRMISAVPEPATWAMMLVGFGGVGFAMRRKRKNERAHVLYA